MPRGHFAKDWTGVKVGRLTVVSRAENKGKKPRWNCICECGGTAVVHSVNLQAKTTQSCGCLQKERTSAAKKRHGQSYKENKTKEYEAWLGAVARTGRPSHKRWPYYGGRGIEMCFEWRCKFENFLHDMGKCPHPSLSLERVDNDGHYNKSNCIWGTKSEQMLNKRRKASELKECPRCDNRWNSDTMDCPICGLTFSFDNPVVVY